MADQHWTDQAAIDAWLEWLKGRGKSGRTIEAYGMAVRKLHAYLRQDGQALLDAGAQQLELFTGIHLHRMGVVARSRVPYISAVRGFFAWAESAKIVRRSPARELQHPTTAKPLPNVISLENAERLMWAPDMSSLVGIRDAAMLALLMGCGLRVSGLVGLNEGDLQPMQIDKQARLVVRVTEKGGKTRLVPVPREAEMLIRVYLAHEELAEIDRAINVKKGKATVADRVLFVSVRSTAHSPDQHRGEARRLTRKGVHDRIQFYGRKLGIPAEHLHPHSLRHLFGTELTEGDVSLASTQDLLGHADPKTTAVYIQLAQRKRAQVIDQHAPLAKMTTPVSELLKRLPPG